MPQCFVKYCGNYYGKTKNNSKVIYHMLPSSPSLVQKWVEACGHKKATLPTPHARVCSAHFSPACYQRDLQHELLGLPLRKKLKFEALPDQNLPVRKKLWDGAVRSHSTQTKTTNVHSKHINQKKNPVLTIKTNAHKVNNKLNRLPLRSSIRIAKKKSIECLSDSFTSKINNKARSSNKKECFTDKLKFMAKLELKFERNFTFASNHLLEQSLNNQGTNDTQISLNKMQIMEDVREGCNVQPSSPGHAEQRTDEVPEIKPETLTENGFSDETSNIESNKEEETKDYDKKEDKTENDALQVIKSESQTESNQFVEESYSNASSPDNQNKRKQDSEDSPTKRLRSEIQENFLSRDKILNEFIEMTDCNSVHQIQIHSEQILSEIRTLNELAKEKEREWNNIIHLKKIKEEVLIRLQRKKQIMLLNDKIDYSEILSESQNDSNEEHFKTHSSHSILKTNLSNSSKSSLRIPNINSNLEKSSRHRTLLPRPTQSSLEINGGIDFRQGRQRPVLDVQSIIADFRQRHPEIVPRRGRRIRHSQRDSSPKNSNNVLNFSSMAFGSGSQVRHNSEINNELGLLLNSMNGSRTDGSSITNADSFLQSQDTTSFKDMLVQIAKLSQSERNELIQNAIKPPPPYPEVTVHPVPTTTAPPSNSLLHGILTKSPSKNIKTSFSPTLARLLTAPERAVNNATSTPISSNTLMHPSNMSISEILSTSKARNEITITPVGTQFDISAKGRSGDDEEAEDSVDRLVIDESNEIVDARKGADNNSEAGDEIPQCQGCNQKSAQFVCAGCGNQWYCSRDCQVSAWDEHSEVCSG